MTQQIHQPTSPTGDPLDYRCPSCGLFPGRRCITSRNKPHKLRVEVAEGRRKPVPDDTPDPNAGFRAVISAWRSELARVEPEGSPTETRRKNP